MSVTHVIIRSCQKATSIAPLQLAENVVGDMERNVSLIIPAQTGSPLVDTANYPVEWAVTRAKLESFAVQSDKPVTIYTNNPSGSSPQDTIPLVVTGGVGQVLIWTLQTDGIARCPFAGDVTILYVTPTVPGDAPLLQIDAVVNN